MSHSTMPISAAPVASASRSPRSSARRRASTRLVMSANDAMTPRARPSAPGDSGWALIDSQRRASSGSATCISASRTGRPVSSATVAGCSSPGNGEPSARNARQRGSVGVRPSIWSRLNPRIDSAAGLQLTIVPSAAWTTTPTASDSNSSRKRSRSSVVWRREPVSSLSGRIDGFSVRSRAPSKTQRRASAVSVSRTQ
jgi:hypothetical protein